MGISKIFTLILVSMSMISCIPNRSSENQEHSSKKIDYSSIVEKKCKWVEITEIKQYNGFYLSSKGYVYGLNIDSDDSFPIDDYLQSLTPMRYVDARTLKICINDDNEPYAKDSTRVYYAYLNDPIFEDGENMCAELYGGDVSIKDADPKTFKYLGQGYAIDKNNMYYRGQRIGWNDNVITALQRDDCPNLLPIDYEMANDER